MTDPTPPRIMPPPPPPPAATREHVQPTTGAPPWADLGLTADQHMRIAAAPIAAHIAHAGGRSSDLDDVLDLADGIADWIRTGTRPTALTDDPETAYRAGWEEACELVAQKCEQAADALAARDYTPNEDVRLIGDEILAKGFVSGLREAARVARGTNPAPANPAPTSSTPAADPLATIGTILGTAGGAHQAGETPTTLTVHDGRCTRCGQPIDPNLTAIHTGPDAPRHGTCPEAPDAA